MKTPVPLYHRINFLSNNELCHIWNRLTAPYIPRLDCAHKACNRAAKYIKSLLTSRGARLHEDCNGNISIRY